MADTNSKTGKRHDPKIVDFLADYHNFASQWPTQKIAELFGMTRQNVYAKAKSKRKK